MTQAQLRTGMKSISFLRALLFSSVKFIGFRLNWMNSLHQLGILNLTALNFTEMQFLPDGVGGGVCREMNGVPS